MTAPLTTRTTSVAPKSNTQQQEPAKTGTSIIETSPLAWIAKLAKRMLAQSLNMPEPLLHHTGVFVFAHVQAAEDRALKTLCPFTLLRQFLARRRKS